MFMNDAKLERPVAIHKVKWRHGNRMVKIRSLCCEATRRILCEVKWRYSNKIESIGLRKCPCYHYFAKEVIS